MNLTIGDSVVILSGTEHKCRRTYLPMLNAAAFNKEVALIFSPSKTKRAIAEACNSYYGKWRCANIWQYGVGSAKLVHFPENVGLIIFDIDVTLVDQNEISVDVFGRTAKEIFKEFNASNQCPILFTNYKKQLQQELIV